MCLAIPGQIMEIIPDERHARFVSADVSFGGVVKRVSLALVPEAGPGDYVVVHAGFAIAVIDEAQANATLAALTPPEDSPP